MSGIHDEWEHLRRPNHYYDDSLGDPNTCEGDHNHPVDLVPLTENTQPPQELTLDERAEIAARDARCNRCEAVILDERSKLGVLFGRVLVPLLGVKHTFQLCGKCGLGLREYLFPWVIDDPTYQAVKTQLLTEHW